MTAKRRRSIALSAAVRALEEIAPLDAAADWDNVGLLVEPPGRTRVRSILLTIDLTAPVVEEAIARKFDLVVAYHPPIFAPLTRLTHAEPGQRTLLECIAGRVAIYSPHTALDAVRGGVNDWLADGLGAGERSGIEPCGEDPEGPAQGRRVELARPVTLNTLVRRIKNWLGLRSVRIAAADAHRSGGRVGSVALCPGAGASVVAGAQADVFWTGEMRHHDVLAAIARGTSVILCEHSNTERGYLPRLRDALAAALPSIVVTVAAADSEPLQTA